MNPVFPLTYLQEIVDVAKNKNSIAFLPSADDKSFVFLSIVRLRLIYLHQNKLSHRKSIAFLANTRYSAEDYQLLTRK